MRRPICIWLIVTALMLAGCGSGVHATPAQAMSQLHHAFRLELTGHPAQGKALMERVASEAKASPDVRQAIRRWAAGMNASISRANRAIARFNNAESTP